LAGTIAALSQLLNIETPDWLDLTLLGLGSAAMFAALIDEGRVLRGTSG
jgi:hypothetical protein